MSGIWERRVAGVIEHLHVRSLFTNFALLQLGDTLTVVRCIHALTDIHVLVRVP